jgi:hypothetical protein
MENHRHLIILYIFYFITVFLSYYLKIFTLLKIKIFTYSASKINKLSHVNVVQLVKIYCIIRKTLDSNLLFHLSILNVKFLATKSFGFFSFLHITCNGIFYLIYIVWLIFRNELSKKKLKMRLMSSILV